MDIVALKQRYGIVGHSPLLDRAIHVAVQVAVTDLSVLVMGESGVGKENFPKIIHDNSACKHGPYIAVNCGAIPEGTIDSELFGHEKGSFTGASDTRRGYFEVADGGSIFLDEVTDLPVATQVRLLRVLETGDFIKVGSSKVQKTKVRIIAATNVNIGERIARGKFREDLYYRLNTVPIHVPALRERGDDVALLFLKFASDFATKYRFPQLELTTEGLEKLKEYYWPGNIRQLKNVTEQMSLIEKERLIDGKTLEKYLITSIVSGVPALIKQETVAQQISDSFERELIFRFLADMKREVGELRNMVTKLAKKDDHIETSVQDFKPASYSHTETAYPYHQVAEDPLEASIVEDNYSITDSERELIKKALEKHNYKRKKAAEELGISERTLYRKINDYGL